MQISLTCSERWKVNFIYVFLSADLVLPSLFAKSKTTHELSPQLPQGSFQRKASGSSTGVESDPKLMRNQFVQIGFIYPQGDQPGWDVPFSPQEASPVQHQVLARDILKAARGESMCRAKPSKDPKPGEGLGRGVGGAVGAPDIMSGGTWLWWASDPSGGG